MAGFLANQPLAANEITEAAEKRRASGLPLIDLTSTNPTRHGFLFPPEILEEAAGRYFKRRVYEPHPKGLLAARQAIADYYNKRQKVAHISPEQVFITASTSEAYNLLFALFCDPGDNVLAPDFSYPLFDLLAGCREVELKNYRLKPAQDGWSISEPSLLAAAGERTRAVMLISPHNPTGMCLTKALGPLNELRLPVICDEVFSEFTWGENPSVPFFALHTDIPVIVLNGISKMFALPDLKLGWMVLNDPAYRIFGERLEVLNDLFLSANSLSQSMLPTLFACGFEFVRSMREELHKKLLSAAAVFSGLEPLKLNVPEGGYMLTLHLGETVDEEALVLRLIAEGVLVHPGYFYGSTGESCLVLSALVEQPDFQRGLNTVKDFLLSSM